MTEEEFKKAVLPHHKMMLAEAMRLLKNRDEALDCLQDAITSLWKSRSKMSQVENIKAYCLKSVSNRALEMMRQQHISYSEYSNDLQGDVTPVSTLESIEKGAIIKLAINSLPENERKVVLMRAINGMTSEERANATGFTPANVRLLLHRGRKRLKDFMKKHYGI